MKNLIKNEAYREAVDEAVTTVDHPEIRGSTLSGVADIINLRRELPRTTSVSPELFPVT